MDAKAITTGNTGDRQGVQRSGVIAVVIRDGLRKFKVEFMNDAKVVATYREAVQIGPDSYQMVNTARVISVSRPISDLYNWLKAEGVKNPTLSCVELHAYTGESL